MAEYVPSPVKWFGLMQEQPRLLLHFAGHQG